MKIASFNINGVKARLPALLDWLRDAAADVVVLQELKSTDDQFPRLEIEEMGYNIETHGQKGFNGVADPVAAAARGRPPRPARRRRRRAGPLDRGRRSPAIRVCGLYLPNGNPAPGPKYDYKLAWMDRLEARAADADRHRGNRRNPRGLQRDPRAERLLGPEGLGHATPCSCPRPAPPSAGSSTSASPTRCAPSTSGPGIYTFWDYQAGAFQKNWGIRIDHVLLTPQAADRLETCGIDAETRSPREALRPRPDLGDARRLTPRARARPRSPT